MAQQHRQYNKAQQSPPNNNRNPSQNATTQRSQGVQGALTVRSFSQQIQKFEQQIAGLIPRAMKEALTPTRAISLAVNAFQGNNDLRVCTPASIINSVALSASMGLEFNTPLQQAWLIPYKGVCTLQVGYRGLITLANRSGRVHDIDAHVVVEGDEFEYRYGSKPELTHVPVARSEVKNFNLKEDWTHAYAMVYFKEGAPSFLVMDRVDIEHVRNQAAQGLGYDSSPWNRYPEQMIRKTPTKNKLKYLDLSNHLSRALSVDDQAEVHIPQENAIEWQDYEDLDPNADRDPDKYSERKTTVQGSDTTQQQQNPPQQSSSTAPAAAETQSTDTQQQPTSSSTEQQKQSQSSNEEPWPDSPNGNANNFVADMSVKGPLTQDMFSDTEFESLEADFKAAKGGNKAQLLAWLGRWTGTKGDAIATTKRRRKEHEAQPQQQTL